eukprot:6950263-Pyramimonas_sp.AAC.2
MLQCFLLQHSASSATFGQGAPGAQQRLITTSSADCVLTLISTSKNIHMQSTPSLLTTPHICGDRPYRNTAY